MVTNKSSKAVQKAIDETMEKVKEYNQTVSRNYYKSLLSNAALPTCYINDDGKEINIYHIAVSVATGSYQARRIRDSRPTLYGQMIEDCISVAMLALLGAKKPTLKRGTKTESLKAINNDIKKAYYYSVATDAVATYIASNEAYSINSAIRRAIRELMDNDGIDRKTATKRIRANISVDFIERQENRTFTAATSWVDAVKMVKSPRLDNDILVCNRLTATGLLEDGDTDLLMKVFEDKLTFTSIKSNNKTRWSRIVAAVKVVYPNGVAYHSEDDDYNF